MSDSQLTAAVRSGRLTVGTFVSSASQPIADVIASGSLDWMIVDLEHGVPDVATAAAIVRGAGSKTATLARVPSGDPHSVELMLDAGAAGVVIPRVASAEDAERELAPTRYAGERGLARAVPAFGWGANVEEDPLERDANVLRVVQIETAAALEDVERIARLPWVDVLFLGPADLALDLRRTGQTEAVPLTAAAEKIVDAARAASKVAGTLVRSEIELARWFELGYTFLACSADVRIVADGVGRIGAEADRLRSTL